jgi:hypothetical protein
MADAAQARTGPGVATCARGCLAAIRQVMTHLATPRRRDVGTGRSVADAVSRLAAIRQVMARCRRHQVAGQPHDPGRRALSRVATIRQVMIVNWNSHHHDEPGGSDSGRLSGQPKKGTMN